MESAFLRCPLEVREMIYNYAFEGCIIHVCDVRLKRCIGGPHRPANRRSPGLLHVNKQTCKEAWSTLARHATLVFNDHFNFAQLASVVPISFAKLVRQISLVGDVVPGTVLERFCDLDQVVYHQLGNCFFVPTGEKGFAKRVSLESSEEVIESVLGRSPSLVLLQQALKSRIAKVSLIVKAKIMSQHEHMVCLRLPAFGHIV